MSSISASKIPISVPEFPKVVGSGNRLFLKLADGREYPIPADPIKVLGLLHHLSGKRWAGGKFLHTVIARIAGARGWAIHPFQR